ncbi:DNA polymerase/3'-5' exonuclease PolX [Reichenbachiella agariperforans]|uniref:DNA polymerase/3'-5' exonuclease PolX n=1 Tax=Reichenbachiella agariperforans TaxID=156994 RepID=UPI001C082645|nr:DNA polymerase/3'-5' exonuclease PolX [Reichenbachiella agariperforans]MBU2914831.1 DNA polymerase/3'-5' exonuclease PolX [Reichenbachiella agariperforans]
MPLIKIVDLNNSEIKNSLKLAAQLMELHGENPFKTRSYVSAADVVGGLDAELSTLSTDEILAIDGIGKGMATNISGLLERGSFDNLDKYMEMTPAGVVEMLGISGFGPKKVAVLWQEGGAETLEQLMELCLQGKVASLKGFAEKSQETLKAAVAFLISNQYKEKYGNIDQAIANLVSAIDGLKEVQSCSESGQMRRRMEVIDLVEIVVAAEDLDALRTSLNALQVLSEEEKKSGPTTWYGRHVGIKSPLKLHLTSPDKFVQRLVETTGSVRHINMPIADQVTIKSSLIRPFESEEELYQSLGMKYIVPELREGLKEIEWAKNDQIPALIEMSDLKGILHNHSTYSDGKHTLRQMAEHCQQLGYEYLGISDHSQTAVYAGGLQDADVARQQEEIKQLNEELAPFKVFSGIESDILADGSLDYSEEILSSFDFIVASVHSGLNMDVKKATDRLLKAIHNPHTTILGHMTGRLLVQREGYPVDHKAIIEACAETGVVIEINASPYRLDMDWRWIDYALEKGVKLSINPDAHRMDGYQDMYYGLQVARKGGLTAKDNLNSMSLPEITAFFEQKKKKK